MENKYRGIIHLSDITGVNTADMVKGILTFLHVSKLVLKENTVQAEFKLVSGIATYYIFFETENEVKFRNLHAFLQAKYGEKALQHIKLTIYNKETNKFRIDDQLRLHLSEDNSSYSHLAYNNDQRLSTKTIKLVLDRLNKGYTGLEITRQCRKQAKHGLISGEFAEDLESLISALGLSNLSCEDAITVCKSVLSLIK